MVLEQAPSTGCGCCGRDDFGSASDALRRTGGALRLTAALMARSVQVRPTDKPRLELDVPALPPFAVSTRITPRSPNFAHVERTDGCRYCSGRRLCRDPAAAGVVTASDSHSVSDPPSIYRLRAWTNLQNVL